MNVAIGYPQCSLCTHCKEVFREIPWRHEIICIHSGQARRNGHHQFRHYPSLEAFQNGKDTGCAFCNLLWLIHAPKVSELIRLNPKRSFGFGIEIDGFLTVYSTVDVRKTVVKKGKRVLDKPWLRSTHDSVAVVNLVEIKGRQRLYTL
ncbi:hypothetical protein AB1N83_005097 [Pleurotus pulmonarius]